MCLGSCLASVLSRRVFWRAGLERLPSPKWDCWGFLLDFRSFGGLPGWVPELTGCGDVEANPDPDNTHRKILHVHNENIKCSDPKKNHLSFSLGKNSKNDETKAFGMDVIQNLLFYCFQHSLFSKISPKIMMTLKIGIDLADLCSV